ncbi:MAG: chitobiase/beta-hexosaminidase C-terminal domain-containing protein, partial [Flavobacteriales bacterium]
MTNFSFNGLKYLLFACVLFLFTSVNGQVVINEFSCSNYSLNIGGDNEDYIEFYNPGAVAEDIGGFFLSDNPMNPDKFEIPAGTLVPAGGYLLVMCSGEGELITNLYMGGNLNTNFKINQCAGESIVFSDPSESILEQYDFVSTFGTTQADHSWAREVDGAAVWSICTNPSPAASNTAGMFTGYAPTPVFSSEAGFYAGGVDIFMNVPAGYEVRYTTDGYAPNAGSTLYTGTINILTTTVLRAYMIDLAGNESPSFIETNTYFTGADSHTIAVVSVSGDGQEDGAWPGGGDEPMHIEFFQSNGMFRVEATGDSNEHGNDSNAYGQRGFDYVTRDQMGYDYAIEAQLFSVKQRDKYQRIIFKAAANDNYPFEPGAHIRDSYVHTLSHKADLRLDERTSESCIVYLNGQYWGVYDYREKVDDTDFTTEYYDQPRHFVDFLKTWGGTWEEYGSGDDWYDLVNFVTGQDMTVDANYEYAISQLHPMSLIDYFVLNSYVVCMDWLNWNTAWWRGRHPEGGAKRWRYALWD